MDKTKLENYIAENKSLKDIQVLENKCQSSVRYWLKKYGLSTNFKNFGSGFWEQEKEFIKPKTRTVIFEEFDPTKWTEIQQQSYSYIFGLYLGDGCLNELKNRENNYRLRITQDNKYPKLIEDCRNAITNLLSTKTWLCNKIGCKDITTSKKDLNLWFPQHGLGKKHEREIKLENWQIIVLDKYPQEFIKGLIHSDGCRYEYEIKNKYKFVGYNFTNKSKDIMDIFTSYLTKLSIKHRIREKNKNKPTSMYVCEITKTSEVIKLDLFIGPKS